MYIEYIYSKLELRGHVFPALYFPTSSKVESSWGQEDEGGASAVPAEIQLDSSQLPLVEGPDGEQVFRFYWLDAFEEPYNHPGIT